MATAIENSRAVIAPWEVERLGGWDYLLVRVQMPAALAFSRDEAKIAEVAIPQINRVVAARDRLREQTPTVLLANQRDAICVARIPWNDAVALFDDPVAMRDRILAIVMEYALDLENRLSVKAA